MLSGFFFFFFLRDISQSVRNIGMYFRLFFSSNNPIVMNFHRLSLFTVKEKILILAAWQNKSVHDQFQMLLLIVNLVFVNVTDARSCNSNLLAPSRRAGIRLLSERARPRFRSDLSLSRANRYNRAAICEPGSPGQKSRERNTFSGPGAGAGGEDCYRLSLPPSPPPPPSRQILPLSLQ